VQPQEFVILPDVRADVEHAVDPEQVEQLSEVTALIPLVETPLWDDREANASGQRAHGFECSICHGESFSRRRARFMPGPALQ